MEVMSRFEDVFKEIEEVVGGGMNYAGSKVVEKCDDGYSGVKFDDRPQFMEMIRFVKEGKINWIIVKDFSRFGRNYVELGDYLEQLFLFSKICGRRCSTM